MDITMMAVEDIRPYEKNAKKHPEEQVEHIANSIREFGWQQPLVVDKNDVLVIGHGRWRYWRFKAYVFNRLRSNFMRQ